jgi:hypothetical protein
MAALVGTHVSWLRRAVVTAVPLLLVAGGVGAALVTGDGAGSDDTHVAALQSSNAGSPAAEAEAGTTAPVPTTVVTTITRRSPATTIGRSAVLFESPPITQALPESTRPTTPTTVAVPVIPATTVPPTTTTTFPANAAIVTIVNNFSGGVTLLLNDVRYDLATGQRLVDVPVIPGPSGNDTVTLTSRTTPACGVGDADNLFLAGQRFTFTITTRQGACIYGEPGPVFEVTPALP